MDRADNVATVSSSSFDNNYERVFRAGDDGDSVLRRPVTFDADVDQTFDMAWAVDKEKERLLVNENTRSGSRRGWRDRMRMNELSSGAATRAPCGFNGLKYRRL